MKEQIHEGILQDVTITYTIQDIQEMCKVDRSVIERRRRTRRRGTRARPSSTRPRQSPPRAAPIPPGPAIRKPAFVIVAVPVPSVYPVSALTLIATPLADGGPAAADLAHSIHGWLVAEESLGVSGAGDLSIITSSGDYPIAAGKKSALAAKTASAHNARSVLLAENIPEFCNGQGIHIEDVAACDCEECRITLPDASGRFSNPLLAVPGYHTPLMLAAAAAMILGIDPAPLSSFCALPGRMSVSRESGLLVVDNANSGTNAATTISAARYARQLSGVRACGEIAGRPKMRSASRRVKPASETASKKAAARSACWPSRLAPAGRCCASG